MSKLDKLMIQGIRAFNPREKSVLEFYTPLTLIVGANGTGKTTVIECLKYITTGDMPPNSRGGAFIYDPKIAKEIDIRAEVKLRFINNKNEVLLCSRSMQSSMRKTRAEQKTLECSLSREINGREVLITTRLGDVDRDVPEHLGVSYSILENVIFCHQDESIWPIGDPTIMKKKLDDIFSSTKYNKALLGLKASKKEIAADLKLKTQQLSFFLKEKMKRDDILKKIEAYNEEMEKKNVKLRAFGDEIARIEQNMKAIADELTIYEKLDQNYKLLKTELDNCMGFVNNFPYEVLSAMDKEHAIQRVREIEQSLLTLNSLNIEEEFSRVEKYRLRVLEESQRNEEKLSKIQSDEHSLKNLMAERKDSLDSLMDEFGCAEYELPEKITTVFKVAEDNIKQKEVELEREKEILILQKNEQKTFEKTANEKREFINRYKDLKPGPDAEVVDITVDYDKQLELEATVDELLEDVNAKQNKMNETFKQSEKAFKRTLLIEAIEKLKSETETHPVSNIEREIEERTDALDKLKDQCKQAGLEEQKNRIMAEQNDVSNSKIVSEMVILFDKINFFDEGTCDYAAEVENRNNSTSGCNAATSTRIIQRIKELSCASIPRLTSKDVMALKQLANSDALKLEPLRGTDRLLSEIEDCKGKIENNKYAGAVYRNFLELGNKHRACPLCKKHMEDETMLDFKTKLETFLARLPDNVKAVEMKLETLKKNVKMHEKLNADIEERNNAKTRIRQLMSELLTPVFESSVNNTASMLEKKMHEDQAVLDRLKQELTDINNKKDQLRAMENELRSIPENGDITSIKESLSNARSRLEQKRAELSLYNKEIKQKENLLKLIQQEKENRENIRIRDKYIEDLASAKAVDLEALESSVAAKEDTLDKIKRRYIKRKMDVEIKNERILQIDRVVNQIKNEIAALKTSITNSFCGETVMFNKQVLQVSALKSTSEYEKIRSQIIGHKNKIIKLTRELEIAKYNLLVVEENIKLRKTKERIISIEDELKNFDWSRYAHLKDRYAQYDEKKTKMSNSESVVRGELKQIAHALRSLGEELETYASSNKNYLTCALEIKALEFSLDDMDRCVNGLDKAIVDFHGSKIEEVNKTLRDLWCNTYKGNDIDYIELKSESSETRAYNYRMTMVKNGVELDMRGRSSAGQKMIASILFRIALADSFSCGCNVLALDEPTTNLDKENIESLAQTLSLIIKERTDFQLIVITHDEEFVQLLNREGTEYFYRLKRDPNGNGYIERHSIYTSKN